MILGALSLCSEIIIPQTNFRYNESYPLKNAAGRYGWFTGVDRHNGEEIMFQLGLTDKLALFGAEPFIIPRSITLRKELYEHRIQLFKAGKLPLTGPNQPYYGAIPKPPTPEQIKELAGLDNFLGWRPFNEWGTGLDRMMNAAFKNVKVNTTSGIRQAERGKEIFKGMKEPETREEFEALAKHAWNTVNAPWDFEVYVLDGSHYWAKAWPGGWNRVRAIITENRVPYRSNTLMQAITRGAARMWAVPYGYLSAYDWYARIGHPVYDHMQSPRPNYQNQQGMLKINPNLYRRMWYYMVMGNTTILADESDHAQFADYSGSGQYRFNWYGELCQEIRDFIELNPDLGVQWNPVGIVLSWHNGVVYRGDKAFYRFPYNDGEHMTRELLHRVIYNFSENKAPMDELAPTPYGDLFDILRLDTPRGPLSLELLENYKVLFLAGEQNFTPEVTARINEYVKNGGTVILNSEQVKGKFNADFLGVEISNQLQQTQDIISISDKQTMKTGEFTYSPLLPGKNTSVLYQTTNGAPLVTRAAYGKGFVICMGAHWLLENKTFLENNSIRRTILPLAGDILKKLLPSLIPFSLEGENVDKQVLYQVNRKGEGWVVAMSNSDGRTASGKAHHGYIGPDIVDVNKAVTVKMVLPSELNNAAELMTGEKYYPISNGKKYFLDINLQPGELKIIELQPSPIPDRTIIKPKNLAQGKPASASSSMPKHGPEKAVDGSEDYLSAWWSKDACPQWLTLDLEKIETINSVRTVSAWSEDNNIFPRIFQYKVEAGVDNQNWITIVDESKNMQPDTQRGLHRYFTPVQARFVRISILHNVSRQGGQVVEFQVFGPQTEKVTIPFKIDPAKISFPAGILRMHTRKYLSDKPLKMISVKQDEKTLAYDHECYHGKPLRIRGREFTKGLGSHANSEIIYELNPADSWKLFTAHVGIDDNSAPIGTVEFQVYVDGKLVANSGKLTMRDNPVPIWANLENAKELKLVIHDCNDGINGDIADWADASIRK